MTWSVLTIHVFSERSCRFKKEFWAKIRGMSSQKGGSVEELKKQGWGAALAFFDGLPMEEVKKRLGATCESWGLEEFEELRQEKVALDREENLVMQNPSSGLSDVTWVPQTGHAVHRGRALALEMARARTLMPRMSWPTRYQRRMHHAQEDAQRDKIEEEERDRQIRKLMELLNAAELIDGDDKRGEEASVWMVRRRAMGRRANTLRAHVRMGQRMQEFASAALGRSWFEGPGDVMDYIAGRVEEPCGKSVPASVYSALKFLEMSAEVPREKRISEDETLRNFMAEISKSHWWVSREKASAHRLVLAVVMCLEFLVMVDEESLYIRLYAWFKLVKLWGMLRWSDTLGIPASRVRFHRKEGLVGEIVRSKTTGVGRRVEVQTFYISDKARGCYQRLGWRRDTASSRSSVWKPGMKSEISWWHVPTKGWTAFEARWSPTLTRWAWAVPSFVSWGHRWDQEETWSSSSLTTRWEASGRSTQREWQWPLGPGPWRSHKRWSSVGAGGPQAWMKNMWRPPRRWWWRLKSKSLRRSRCTGFEKTS